ncbi:hypothetical protein R1flu_006029 [Riccia fluitans]|uniref:Uncharacterized protein n=1 Tax=Riccia fluitans TaxID=41844 RepID=A0ABD1YUU5_9MARC
MIVGQVGKSLSRFIFPERQGGSNIEACSAHIQKLGLVHEEGDRFVATNAANSPNAASALHSEYRFFSCFIWIDAYKEEENVKSDQIYKMQIDGPI